MVLAVIEAVYRFLWGDLFTIPIGNGNGIGIPLLVLLLIPTGIYFTIRTKFLPVRLFPDMIRALGKDRMEHFHIKESQVNEDGFLSVETPIVLMGTGDTYFRESAQAVKDIGFHGWIVSENFYFRANILEQGYDYVSAARKDLESLHAVYGTD